MEQQLDVNPASGAPESMKDIGGAAVVAKDRPILFSAPMVRALLAGTKTQTRRAMKPQPPQHTVAVGNWQDPPGYDPAWWAFIREGAVEHDHPFAGAEIHGGPWRCPYGKPGDRLWVRETWGYFDPDGGNQAFDECGPLGQYREEMLQDGHPLRDYWRRRITYVATWQEPKYGAGPAAPARWRPSIHMPRWASRVLLEITAVRVERLQDISDADALAEGVDRTNTSIGGYAKERYRHLWEQINGPGSWDANPWVWVIAFKQSVTTTAGTPR